MWELLLGSQRQHCQCRAATASWGTRGSWGMTEAGPEQGGSPGGQWILVPAEGRAPEKAAQGERNWAGGAGGGAVGWWGQGAGGARCGRRGRGASPDRAMVPQPRKGVQRPASVWGSAPGRRCLQPWLPGGESWAAPRAVQGSEVLGASPPPAPQQLPPARVGRRRKMPISPGLLRLGPTRSGCSAGPGTAQTACWPPR